MDQPAQSLSSPGPNPDIRPSQVVCVVAWLVAASFVTATATRLGTKFSMGRVFGVDDGFAIAATVKLKV